MWGFLLVAFNCRNSLISDEWRQFVLDEVNNYRRSLAMGKVYDKLKNFLPGAKNMNKLNWDCNLEEIAYQAMGGKCATLDLLTFPYVPLQVQNVTSQMKLNLFGWWTEVEHYDMKNKTKYDDERIRDFAQMTILICSFCNYFLSIYINMDIYDPTWTESEICNACAANCTDRLCPQTPYTPVTINATCKDDKLTQDSNNAALWMHNYYRKLLASGWAKDPKSKSGYAPPGKQMKALEYDCSNATGTSVAEQTYKAIENCQQTGTPNATPGYSMNFLRINDHKISEQDALKQVRHYAFLYGIPEIRSDLRLCRFKKAIKSTRPAKYAVVVRSSTRNARIHKDFV
ncbi:SCP-like protein [Ancylostoma ceylanicum]|uniref:SCP-like protein n=1 Tax=Ancylostoma ceylanicum TaxID=53326 RepID=A0A0D6M8C1_9BILA|nr:SCP-like protein [Ancylostoma ceylanicum]